MPSALNTPPATNHLQRVLKLPSTFTITQKLDATYRADGRAHLRFIYKLDSPTAGHVSAYAPSSPAPLSGSTPNARTNTSQPP